MINELKDKLTDEDLLNAPKVLRTHCYCQQPFIYDIQCLICGEKNITWSEFENHIWCYDCNKDVFIPHVYAGIFGGPIPKEITKLVGISFDRIEIKTVNITKDPGEQKNTDWNNYDNTWVKNKKLDEYKKKLNKKIFSE